MKWQVIECSLEELRHKLMTYGHGDISKPEHRRAIQSSEMRY